jgi:hypothetical protein
MKNTIPRVRKSEVSEEHIASIFRADVSEEQEAINKHAAK